MALFNDLVIRTRDDLEQFEAAMPIDQRLPEQSILDVFRLSAAQHPTATAITMLMTGSESIRDVIAFPKTQTAACTMTNAPSPVDNKQLREVGVQVRKDDN